MENKTRKTITSLNDLQLAEIIELLRYILDCADRYSADTLDAHKKAFEGLITALEYFRLVDDKLKEKDPAFNKMTLKENLKSNVIISILRNSPKIKEKGQFSDAYQIMKEYIEKRKAEITIAGKLA